MADNVYQELVTRIKLDATKLEAGLKKTDNLVGNTAKGWTRHFGTAGAAVKGMGIQVGGLSSVLAPVIGALGIRQIVQYSDAWKGVQNRLRLVTGSTAELSQITNTLFKIAQETRSDLAATVTLYQRLTFATKGLGITQQEVLTFTEQLNKQLLVGGLSATEARTSIYQLTQAFNKGKLDGDEFRTILESAPPILEALEKSLNKSRGAILAMAAAGKLGPREIVNAVNSMTDVTNERFKGLSITIDQSFTILQNAFTQFIGTSGEVNSAASIVADSLASIADNMELAGRVALTLGAVLVTRLAIGFVSGLAAINPFAAALVVVVGTLSFVATGSRNAAQSVDEFTAELKRQETVLGKVDIVLQAMVNRYAEASIVIQEFLGLVDKHVAAEAKLDLLSGGRASYTRPRTVNEVTFKDKKDVGSAPPAGEEKSVLAAQKALKKYVDELYRQQDILKLLPREQAAVEAAYRAQELAIKAKVKLSPEEIQSIKDTAAANYDLSEAMQESARFSKELKDQFAETAGSILRDSGSAREALNRLAAALADMLTKRYILGPLADGLFGSDGGGGGLFGDLLGSISGSLFSGGSGGFGGFFAEGGEPPVGMPSIVGEDGPEFFIPKSAGTIIPNSSAMSGGGGGSIVVHQTFQIYPGVEETVNMKIREAAPLIANAAHDAVFASIQRGGTAAKVVGRRS